MNEPWILVGLLLSTGILLLIAEVIFIPGTTVAGILGIVILMAGVYISFDRFGGYVGTYVLISTLVLLLLSLYYSLRSESWKRFSLKEKNTDKINQNRDLQVTIGDYGKTLSYLRPMGKAEFNEVMIEVKALEGWIKSGTMVEVIGKENNIIIVTAYND